MRPKQQAKFLEELPRSRVSLGNQQRKWILQVPFLSSQLLSYGSKKNWVANEHNNQFFSRLYNEYIYIYIYIFISLSVLLYTYNKCTKILPLSWVISVFACYLVVSRPALCRYQENSLTHPILITAFLSIFNLGVTCSFVTMLGPQAHRASCGVWTWWVLPNGWVSHLELLSFNRSCRKRFLQFFCSNLFIVCFHRANVIIYNLVNGNEIFYSIYIFEQVFLFLYKKTHRWWAMGERLIKL